MQKGLIRTGALAFEIVQETAPHLTCWRQANYGGIGDCLFCAQRQFASDGTFHLVVFDRAGGKRMLKSKESFAYGYGRALHCTDYLCVRSLEVEEVNRENGAIVVKNTD